LLPRLSEKRGGLQRKTDCRGPNVPDRDEMSGRPIGILLKLARWLDIEVKGVVDTRPGVLNTPARLRLAGALRHDSLLLTVRPTFCVGHGLVSNSDAEEA